MAEHADAAELTADQALPDRASDVDEHETHDNADKAIKSTETSARHQFSSTRALITVGLVIVAALAGLGGWLGYRGYQDRQMQAQRNLYVQVARATAINLTTIDYTEVDADIKRILDSATGAFREEFQNRSQPFIDVVKRVQSKSAGTVAESALLSVTRDQAQVIVAVSVHTSIAAAPEQEPRRWRLRISVEKSGDSAKVSNVEFVS